MSYVREVEEDALELFIDGDAMAVGAAVKSIFDRAQGASYVLGVAGAVVRVPLELEEREAAEFLDRAEQICRRDGVRLSDRIDAPPSMELIEAWRRQKASKDIPRERLDYTDSELGGAHSVPTGSDLDLIGSRAGAPEMMNVGRRRAWTTQAVIGAALFAAAVAIWLGLELWTGRH